MMGRMEEGWSNGKGDGRIEDGEGWERGRRRSMATEEGEEELRKII